MLCISSGLFPPSIVTTRIPGENNGPSTSLVLPWIRPHTTQTTFEKLPGAAIIQCYVKSSHQNDLGGFFWSSSYSCSQFGPCCIAGRRWIIQESILFKSCKYLCIGNIKESSRGCQGCWTNCMWLEHQIHVVFEQFLQPSNGPALAAKSAEEFRNRQLKRWENQNWFRKVKLA